MTRKSTRSAPHWAPSLSWASVIAVVHLHAAHGLLPSASVTVLHLFMLAFSAPLPTLLTPLQGPLVQIKAGRVNFDRVANNTKMRLAADPRKGELVLTVGEDGLKKLVWRDRRTGSAEVELTLFPGDVTIKRIKAAKETDRIWEFKFTQGNDRRMYFWLQEPDAAGDAELLRKLTEGINQPAGAAGGAAAAGGEGEEDEMSQAALIRQQLGFGATVPRGAAGRGAAGGAPAAPRRPAAPPAGGNLNVDMLTPVLNRLLGQSIAAGATPGNGAPAGTAANTTAAAAPAAAPEAPAAAAAAPSSASGGQAGVAAAAPAPAAAADSAMEEEDPELAAALAMSMAEEEASAQQQQGQGQSKPGEQGQGGSSGSGSG